MVYRRRTKKAFSWWQSLLLLGGAIVIFFVWQSQTAPASTAIDSLVEMPTLPDQLARSDVLPTPTPNISVPERRITFVAAKMTAPITEAYRVGDSWEVRHLSGLVGHLAGTGWLDDPGGNIALAAHVEDADGNPGPFAFLSYAKVGDVIVLSEGQRVIAYHVVTIARAAPGDIQFVVQDGRRRLTLITCADWDAKTASYPKRLVVVAVPGA